MFQRIGSAAYKANLDNTHAISKLLKHPENSFQSIHVAGTNGKGSVSNMLAAVLQSQGYKTGLYTSPHLIDFRERIRINGVMIQKQFITGFVKKHKREFESIAPSFFEWTVGLAFEYFKVNKIDIAIIETGLGGRLDSTNIITPILSIITNISMDHQALLGDTVEKIASEKAGIIKPSIPVIIGEKKKSTKKIFQDKARIEKAPVFFTEDCFKLKELKSGIGILKVDVYFNGKKVVGELVSGLTGNYQKKNIPVVLHALNLLSSELPVSKKSIRLGISKVSKLTGFKGRWHLISRHPLMIADSAHNEDGIKALREQLKKIKYKKLRFVLGVVQDKDISGILKLLPKKCEYYFCRADIPRAMNEKELQIKAEAVNLRGRTFGSVKEAIGACMIDFEPGELILIGGSTFIVGDALKTLKM